MRPLGAPQKNGETPKGVSLFFAVRVFLWDFLKKCIAPTLFGIVQIPIVVIGFNKLIVKL